VLGGMVGFAAHSFGLAVQLLIVQAGDGLLAAAMTAARSPASWLGPLLL